MFSLELALLGLALAIDASVVSFLLGLLVRTKGPLQKIGLGILVSFLFGLSQFLMLWGGSYGGFLFSFSSSGHLFHFVVAALFFLMAAKVFHTSMRVEERELKWGALPLLLLAIGTSMDALAAGVSFGTLPQTALVAFELAVMTVCGCGLFFWFSQFFKTIPDKWPLRFSGLIFLGLGGRIILDSL